MRIWGVTIICIVMGLAAAAARAQGKRSDAVVVVSTTSPLGFEAGNGVVIGDGTYVLTARHLLYIGRDGYDVSSMGVVNLYSPYLGDRCEGYLVFEDPVLDLALLRTTWKGHPSMELATDEEILSLKEIEMESRVTLGLRLNQGDATAFEAAHEVLVERLPVNAIGIREGKPRLVLTEGHGQLKPGWSGSPAMLPGASKVVGVCSTVARRQGPRIGEATMPAVRPIREYLLQKSEGGALRVPASFLPRPADADELFRLWIESRQYTFAKRYEEWSVRLQLLLKARPDHPLAHLSNAIANENLKNPKAAEAEYRKALELDPKSMTARIYFAQFLNVDMRAAEALEMLQEARQIDPLNTVWGWNLCQSLTRDMKYDECIRIANEVLKVSPYDGLVMSMLCDALDLKGDRAEYLKTLGQAAGLMGPGTPVFTRQIGVLLDSRQMAEAEKLIREYLEQAPTHPLPRFMMADLLYRQGRTSEAVFEAERALDLPESPNPTRATIRSTIAKWRAGPASKPASSFPPPALGL